MIVKFDGVDKTSYVSGPTLRIQDVLTQQIDTCTFEVRGLTVSTWQELKVYRDDGTTLEFAGYVTEVDMRCPGIEVITQVTAQDYTCLLSTVIVNEVYEDSTDDTIISSLFTTYLSEIGSSTHVVATGMTVDKLVLERVSLLEAMQALCKQTGADFYVDASKELHYFAGGAEAAPFGLSTSPDGSATYGFSVESHREIANPGELVNKWTIEGGYYLSPDTYFYLAGNGEITELDLPRRLVEPDGETAIKVWKNDGTVGSPSWTALTVGALYLNEFSDGYDVLYGYQEQTLEFNTAPPDLANAIRIQGRYEIPILVRRRSEDSYDTIGRWVEAVYTDTDIETQQQAKDMARALLLDHANAQVHGRAVTREQGLRSGQVVQVTHAGLSLDDEYLIRKVTARYAGGSAAGTSQWTYTIHYGEYRHDLVDLLTELAQNYKQRVVRDDEELNELLDAYYDITLDGATGTVEESDTYRWGDYSGADTEMRWGFFTWG